MNESGASCAEAFDCSCVELNQITELAIRNGAVGSRLTGAGWGGSTVSLVDSKDVDTFMQKMYDGFYKNNERARAISDKKMYLFSSAPAQGAAIVEVGNFLSIDDINVNDLL
jgi:galactokinase